MIKTKIIKNFKYFSINLLALMIMIFPICHAMEYNICISDEQEAYEPNSCIAVGIEIKEEGCKNTLEPFRCNLSFNGENLRYKRINCKNEVKRTDIKYEKSDNQLNLICNPRKTRKLFFSDGKSEIFEVVFTVKNKVLTQTSDIKAEFTSLDGSNSFNSQNIQFNIKGNPGLENCKLNSLKLSAGALSPSFSPDIFDYTAIVPKNTQSLDVEATPMIENLAIKVNRKKLSFKNGSHDIVVTVSNKSPRAKSEYRIEVIPESAANIACVQNSKLKNESTSFQSKSDSSNSGGETFKENLQISQAKPKKASNKTKSRGRKSKTKTKKTGSNSEESDETYDEEDDDSEESDNEETLENQVSSVSDDDGILKIFSTPCTYWIAAAVAGIGAGIYFVLKFIKSKKKIDKNSENHINKNSEK